MPLVYFPAVHPSTRNRVCSSLPPLFLPAEPASKTQTRWLVGFWVATRCEDKRWEVGKYMCVYTYIYIYTYIKCVYVCIHVYIYIYIGIYIYIYVCMCVCVYIYIYTYMYITHTCMYICVHTHVCTCAHNI